MTLKERLKLCKKYRKKVLKLRDTWVGSLTWFERDRLPVLRRYYEMYRTTLRSKKVIIEELSWAETEIASFDYAIARLSKKLAEQEKFHKEILRLKIGKLFFNISQSETTRFVHFMLFSFSITCSIFRTMPTCVRKGMGYVRAYFFYGKKNTQAFLHVCDSCGVVVYFKKEELHFDPRKGVFWRKR